jgi:hypothetical protein
VGKILMDKAGGQNTMIFCRAVHLLGPEDKLAQETFPLKGSKRNQAGERYEKEGNRSVAHEKKRRILLEKGRC